MAWYDNSPLLINQNQNRTALDLGAVWKHYITILTMMSDSLTQFLCLLYVLWTEEDQLLYWLEGSTGCRAGEVVEPWAALSMASNGCTQPFAVFAKLKQTNGNR